MKNRGRIFRRFEVVHWWAVFLSSESGHPTSGRVCRVCSARDPWPPVVDDCPGCLAVRIDTHAACVSSWRPSRPSVHLLAPQKRRFAFDRTGPAPRDGLAIGHSARAWRVTPISLSRISQMTLVATYTEVTISPMNTGANEPQTAGIRRIQWVMHAGWTLTTMRKKLIKIGAKVVYHAKYVRYQLAEVAVPRRLFAAILERIQRLRTVPCMAFSRRPDKPLRTASGVMAQGDALRRLQETRLKGPLGTQTRVLRQPGRPEGLENRVGATGGGRCTMTTTARRV